MAKKDEQKEDQKVSKVHIDLYLTCKQVPVWERSGKKAFAIAKGKEYATEAEFEEIFKKY